MAQIEPMDIDSIESDFDNKENAFHYNNVLSRTPCTEKGYEELDVSELNMKLRYSITPASSPMSKSFTGPYLDNRNCHSDDYVNNAVGAENGNLTRSFNSTLTKTDTLIKSKILPLQTLSADPFVDSNRNSSIHRLVDPTDNNLTISVNNANEIDENLSLPSACSSVPDTPEATTPTKEIPKSEGSPIMRGLKSVLSMFRPSQSPILPSDDKSTKLEISSPIEANKSKLESVQVSTPVAENKQADANSSKRNSPLKESLVFNDDLERELQWKDETTILFKEERIPVHKLFFQNPLTDIPKTTNNVIEHMDISCDESVIINKTNTNIELNDESTAELKMTAGESDNEFLDCENTFTKNESAVSDYTKLNKGNESQVTENVAVSPSDNVQMSISENNIAKNTFCASLEDIIICTDEASVLVTPKIDENNTNSIEATLNLLTSETNDYHKIVANHNIDLENQSQVNKELQLGVNELLLKDNDVISATEVKSSESLNYTTSKNLEGETMEESEQQVYCSSDNLSYVCEETFCNTDNTKEISIQTSHSGDIQEKIGIDDMAVTVKVNVREYPVSDNRVIRRECSQIFDCVPDVNKPSMNNEIGNVVLDSNTNVINNDKDITVFTANKTNNIEDMLDKEHNIIEDVVITPTAKCEDSNKNCAADIPNNIEGILSKCIISEDITVTQTSTDEDNMLIKTAILSSVTDLNNPTISSAVQSGFNDEFNNMNEDVNSVIPELNIGNKYNKENIEDILETDKEAFLFKKSSEEDVESKMDNKLHTSYDINNTVTLNKDPEVSELSRTDTTFEKSPSEIPLPDEDDVEQNVGYNGMHNENCNKQGEMCGRDIIVDVKNELINDSTKCEKAKLVFNTIEEISTFNSINEYQTEYTQNEPPVSEEINNTETCISQSADVLINAAETINMNNKILGQDKAIINSQIAENNILREENVSKNISITEGTYKNVTQDALKMELSENTGNKIMHEKISSNTEEIPSNTETDLVNAEKYGDINNLDKSEDTDQVKLADKSQADVILEKGVDEIDEEIITSANNSPYVSVTDLDIVAEKIPSDPIREIDIPFTTNSVLPSSPPISPKIVSKGYNFNFDEIDDPFATKTKMRMSPISDTPVQSIAPVTTEIEKQEVPKKVNRRKSQAERKKSLQKKNMSSTFSDKLTSKESVSEKHGNSAINIPKVLDSMSTLSAKEKKSERYPENSKAIITQCDKIYEKVEETNKSVTSNADQVSTSDLKEGNQTSNEKIKSIEQTLVISTEKSTSSSEQYFSLGTSSGESSGLMNRSKNVFNLPEIDDINFNPFTTKSKMRMSPPLTEEQTIPLVVTNDVSESSFIIQQQPNNNNIKNNNTDVTFNKIISNYSSPNKSNSTSTSKNTNDIDSTIREILTEDEDTVEGPFLDVDDVTDIEKLTEVGVETDMMNFEEIPQQDRDEHLENGELFIDADAFEFLLNQNKSTTVLDSGKESLFLKFDPLFAKRVSSDGILAALSKVQKRQSTPKKITKPIQKEFTPMETSTAGPSNEMENCGPIEECTEDLSSTITKPMMVVNPAVSSIVSQKKTATPKLNRRSLTFTSPAMAVIDRLLSLSGNSPPFEHDASNSQIGRERSETDLAITQLRELLAEKEINVHSLRSESKELKERLAVLEVEVKGLEMESAERLSKINELNDKLLDKTKVNKSMAIVVEEYERTIASLIAETEQDKKRNAEERMRLIKERDEQTAHLTSMEVSFSDLHSKYEKSKQIILSCKANEDIYKKSIKEFQDNFSKMQNNYELLKQHATSKLNHANQELEKMNRAHEAEVLKMNAMIKRKELHITSLEETLAQKTKANEELTAICDELINKVG